MRWWALVGVGFVMGLMFWYEWPKMKRNSRRDKAVFVSLLLIGYALAMFDLPNMAGPNTLLAALFRPLQDWTK